MSERVNRLLGPWDVKNPRICTVDLEQVKGGIVNGCDPPSRPTSELSKTAQRSITTAPEKYMIILAQKQYHEYYFLVRGFNNYGGVEYN